MLPYVGVLHAITLLGLLLFGLRPSSLDWITKTTVIVVVGWANLVWTAILLSTASALDRPYLYAAVSIVLAGLAATLLRRSGIRPVPEPQPIASVLDGGGLGPKLILAFLLASGALALASAVLLTIALLPTNPDTLTYRLPRIYWYWGYGSLGHFAREVDVRALYYPFNGALLQMPVVQYQWSGRMFTAVCLGAWCLVGLINFRIARNLGFSRKAAIAAAWLACLTPSVLVQATSTNDEIIAAFILLAAVHFAIRFYLSRSRVDLFLTALAASLSVGTKLHFGFFWPIVLLVMMALALRTIRAERTWIRSLRGRDLVGLGAAGLACLATAAAFVWPNLRATGDLTAPGITAGVLNTPFRFDVGLQNLVLHAVQTAMSPFPSLVPVGDAGARLSLFNSFNAVFSGLFTWVQQGPEFTAFYQFAGVVPSTAWYLDETGVDIGLSYVVVIGGWLACRSLVGVRWIGFLLGVALCVWFVTYGLMTRYVEGFTTYFAYAFVVCSPVMVFFLARSPESRNAVRVAVLVGVITANALIAANVLRFGLIRNVGVALNAPAWPVYRPNVDEALVSAMRDRGGAQLMSTHWEVSYWSLMAPLKAGRYSLAAPQHANPERLNLFSAQKIPAYNFLPMRVRDKPSPGLTLGGSYTSSYGPEWVFASGAGIEKDPRFTSGYMVFQWAEKAAAGPNEMSAVEVSPSVFGLSTADRLQFRYRLKSPSGPETVSDWADEAGRILKKPAVGRDLVLAIDVRPAEQPAAVTSREFPIYSSVPLDLEAKG